MIVKDWEENIRSRKIPHINYFTIVVPAVLIAIYFLFFFKKIKNRN